MADSLQQKRRKLNSSRRRLPHVSASALAAVLADIEEHGMPEGGSQEASIWTSLSRYCQQQHPLWYVAHQSKHGLNGKKQKGVVHQPFGIDVLCFQAGWELGRDDLSKDGC